MMGLFTTPSDVAEQVGHLRGRVDELGSRVISIGENLRGLREENKNDHAEVVRNLERIYERLEAKADLTEAVDNERRIDSLERTRDKGRGVMLAFVVLQSILLLVSAVLSVLAASGNL